MCNCNVELSDPLYRSEEFMMFCYKILPCKKTFRHDWRVCPFAHGDETAKRRDPRLFRYTGVICPDAKKGRSCPRGDECPCTHSLFEYWLHPTRFKTEICSRGSRCNRPFCFFAHKQSEIRKPNFRVQMQGVTCEHNNDQYMPSSPLGIARMDGRAVHGNRACAPSASVMRVPHLESLQTPSLFPSTAAAAARNLEGSVISMPESGSPSCEADMSAVTWNSLMGVNSPRMDAPMKNITTKDGGFVSRNIHTSTSVCPILPQIPTSEPSAVNWSIWQPTTDKNKGTAFSPPSYGYETTWNFPPANKAVESSPPYQVAHHVAGGPKDHVVKTSSDNGYDRNYLLATIRDVYQSMLSGCCNERVGSTIPNADCYGESQPQRRLSFGPTGCAGGSHYGSTNGTCGLEGLQQHNGCVPSTGNPYYSTNDQHTLERIMYALFKTDSNMASRYFQ